MPNPPNSDEPNKPWEVRNITVGNVAVPPETDDDRRIRGEAEQAAAERHDPIVTRTLIGGPGNFRRIRGCACRAPGVADAANWSAHVGIPGGERFINKLLALQDAVDDALRYPGEETLANLAAALKRSSP